MTKKQKRLLFGVILFLAVSLFSYFKSQNINSVQKAVQGTSDFPVLSKTPQIQTSTLSAVLQIPVLRVVDGDTVDVLINDKKQSVRILGINTPETVDPRKPVQCFGKQASDEAKSLLEGKTVSLQSDSTQDDKDKYGRLLRYVAMPDGSDFGLTMIKTGFAYEYTYDVPYVRQKEYKEAQKGAEEKGLGLWNESTCDGKL
jgi:micrococcal nuclease